MVIIKLFMAKTLESWQSKFTFAMTSKSTMKGKYFTKIGLINRLSRYLLAAVLLLSGGSKLFYLQGFATEVSLYSELYVSSILVPWSYAIALVVCCVEIGLGILLYNMRFALYSIFVVFALMTFFLYLTGVNYLSPTIFGSVESCGCFGELIHFSAKGSFTKAVILWIVAFVVFLLSIKNISKYLFSVSSN